MKNTLRDRLRKYQYSTAIPIFLMATDAVIVVATLQLIHRHTTWLDGLTDQTAIFMSVNAALCWLVSSMLVSAYQIENLGRRRKLAAHWTATGVLYLLSVLLLTLLVPSLTFNVSQLVVLMAATVPPLIIKIGLLHFYRFYRHQYPYQKKAVIVGYTPRGQDLGRYFTENRSLPQVFMGYFDDNPPPEFLLSDKHLGGTAEIMQYCLDNGVREIYYAMRNNSALLEALSSFAEHNFIYFGIVPDVGGLNEGRRIDTQLYDDSRIPVISTRKAPLRLLVNAQLKRSFDIAFSLLALLFLVPFVFPIIALAIKLESPGPVFFKQLRPGRNNQLFWCYKFRTMRMNNESERQASKNDRRITRVGAILRRTSLDELPQFYNALQGDMSVVGPRPNLVTHLEQYREVIHEYQLRHQITPGITGYAQISGFRGETKELHQMQQRVDYDLWYIENWSMAFDLEIIGRTVWNAVSGEENAY